MVNSLIQPTYPSLNNEQRMLILPLISPIVDVIAQEVIRIVIPQLTQLQEKEKPRYYTRKEVCDLIHVTLPTLSRLIKDGIVESKKVGSRVLIPADFIDKAIAEKRIFQYKRAKK